ncbi:MAG: hypothetical protein IT503_05120 [Burkholderiaceae bacterium]|nr:hypothetical protein [Ideonella sp.]MCC7285543.1 hypothetical protein [Burkholderiaceae bacterium]
MEIERVAAIRAADQAMSVWAAAVDALDAPPAVPGKPAAGPGEAPLAAGAASNERSVPVSEPALPGADADAGHEAATVQTSWRAPTPPAEMHRPHEPIALTTPAAQAELAVPASLLVPATLTGLQVEPATIWPLPIPGAPAWQQPATRIERDREPPHRPRDEPPAEEPVEPAVQPAQPRPQAPDDVLDAEAAGAWCEALSAALRAALAQRIVARSLLCAAEQWQRGRCVVLACPQGQDPAGPGWAFVLWPRACAPGEPLALRGLRVEARLQWRTLPPSAPWCHVRVVKEHHPRHGRQLVPSDAAPRGTALPCDVQLGPVLARSQRWCEVRVHIGAAQRFWAALGKQWSAYVVVSAMPLLSPRRPT